MKYKLSIIVPVYNGERHLKECVESCVCQSMKEVEVICINDGSIDSSENILLKIGEKNSNLKVINQENKGLSNTLNRGIQIASGEFIWVVGHDDVLSSVACEVLYNFADSKYLDVLEFGYTYDVEKLDSDKNVRVICERMTNVGYYRNEINKKEYEVVTWNKIIRKSILIENDIFYDSKIKYAEDHLFNLKLLSSTTINCARLQNKFYFYRIFNPSSMTAKIKSNYGESIIYMLEKMQIFLDGKDEIFYTSMFLAYTQLSSIYCRSDKKTKEEIINSLHENDAIVRNCFKSTYPSIVIKFQCYLFRYCPRIFYVLYRIKSSIQKNLHFDYK